MIVSNRKSAGMILEKVRGDSEVIHLLKFKPESKLTTKFLQKQSSENGDSGYCPTSLTFYMH